MSSSQRFSRNIQLFYIQQFLVGLATLWAPIIVIFQMQEIGLSLTQVIVGESIFAATIVLFEVPSGVFADRMGRKSTLNSLQPIARTIWSIASLLAITARRCCR